MAYQPAPSRDPAAKPDLSPQYPMANPQMPRLHPLEPSHSTVNLISGTVGQDGPDQVHQVPLGGIMNMPAPQIFDSLTNCIFVKQKFHKWDCIKCHVEQKSFNVVDSARMGNARMANSIVAT